MIDKRDLFIDNYPIWLIDTTNMLQKYERIDNKEHNGKPVHTAMNTVSVDEYLAFARRGGGWRRVRLRW